MAGDDETTAKGQEQSFDQAAGLTDALTTDDPTVAPGEYEVLPDGSKEFKAKPEGWIEDPDEALEIGKLTKEEREIAEAYRNFIKLAEDPTLDWDEKRERLEEFQKTYRHNPPISYLGHIELGDYGAEERERMRKIIEQMESKAESIEYWQRLLNQNPDVIPDRPKDGHKFNGRDIAEIADKLPKVLEHADWLDEKAAEIESIEPTLQNIYGEFREMAERIKAKEEDLWSGTLAAKGGRATLGEIKQFIQEKYKERSKFVREDADTWQARLDALSGKDGEPQAA